MDPKKMKQEMHPNLLEFLEMNKINVGESLDNLSNKHFEILGALTEIYRTPKEASQVMKGNYCLTGDNLLKMLAIFIRLRVGIPVVLMGECGCGKTALIKYLSEWLNVDLIVMDVNGGTKAQDIIDIFEFAERKVTRKEEGAKEKEEETSAKRSSTSPSNVYVFLDEVNACNHMGLICEIITKRTIQGVPIHNNIHILAALNPYRRRVQQNETFGLVFKHKKETTNSSSFTNDMCNLVYRVVALPTSLRDFVFDFGSLSGYQEKLYIKSMVDSILVLPKIEGE
jgi:hypothetical protein